MAAYDILLNLVKEYFVDLGYNGVFVEEYFSPHNFKELLSIRLANANVMIKNKTDRSSHQTHIAVTGESIDFFYRAEEFAIKDNKYIDKRKVYIAKANLQNLNNLDVSIADTSNIIMVEGVVTIGKRTQKQLQLSKKNAENSHCFNELRLGLFENDLLILMKNREKDMIFTVGIPQIFYLDYIPNYSSKYETNTYLRMAYRLYDELK